MSCNTSARPFWIFDQSICIGPPLEYGLFAGCCCPALIGGQRSGHAFNELQRFGFQGDGIVCAIEQLRRFAHHAADHAGDAVMIEWQASATVAGQPLKWLGVDRFNLRGDRVYKGQVYWDTRRVAEQVAEAVKRAQQGGSAG